MTRLSPNEFKALTAAPAKRPKYGNTSTEKGASKLETARRFELEQLQARGEISGLEIQPEYGLAIKGEKVCTYILDAGYFQDRQQILEDTKGFKTKDYAIKAKLLLALYPGIRLAEYRKGEGRVFKKLQNGRLLDDKG